MKLKPVFRIFPIRYLFYRHNWKSIKETYEDSVNYLLHLGCFLIGFKKIKALYTVVRWLSFEQSGGL